MELGGWKSYEMVLRYEHLAPDHLSSVATRIERTWDLVGSAVALLGMAIIMFGARPA